MGTFVGTGGQHTEELSVTTAWATCTPPPRTRTAASVEVQSAHHEGAELC